MRIGHGYDAHRFQSGRPLILGGVQIPYEMGLAAHSDGDVIVHALCSALLGAAALGDLGKHFPDTDDKYKNIDSRLLLRNVHQLLNDNQYEIINADITVVLQLPRLAPYVDTMRDNLAADLVLKRDQINIKATTTEKMGFTGRKEGIAAYAVTLIERKT